MRLAALGKESYHISDSLVGSDNTADRDFAESNVAVHTLLMV